MSDLKPTPTRIALLKAVAVTTVIHYRGTGHDPDYSVISGSPDRRKVTAQMRQLESAGWVRLGSPEWPSYYAPRRWEITNAGKKVLEVPGA